MFKDRRKLGITLSALWILASIPISEDLFQEVFRDGFMMRIFALALAATPVWLFYGLKWLTNGSPIGRTHAVIIFLVGIGLAILATNSREWNEVAYIPVTASITFLLLVAATQWRTHSAAQRQDYIPSRTYSRLSAFSEKAAYLIVSLVAIVLVLGFGKAVTTGIFGDRHGRASAWNTAYPDGGQGFPINETGNSVIEAAVEEVGNVYKAREYAETLNKALPRDVDNEIRIENVKAVDMGVEYLITLKNFSASTPLTKEAKRLILASYGDTVCSDANTAKIFSAGFKIKYTYQGNDQTLLHEDVLNLVNCSVIRTTSKRK